MYEVLGTYATAVMRKAVCCYHYGTLHTTVTDGTLYMYTTIMVTHSSTIHVKNTKWLGK